MSGLMSFRGRVHCRTGDALLASRGRCLYISRDNGTSWQFVLKLPVPIKTIMQSIMPASRRLFRQDVYHLIPVDERLVLAFAFHNIFLCDIFADIVVCGPTRIFGSRPLAVCHTPDGGLYYGEYRTDRSGAPVHIFGSEDHGRSWHSVHRIDGVRHIHGVYYDPFENACWVTTGDEDSASAIWISHNRFRSLNKVVGGKQQFRTIRLLFTVEHVYYATDAPDSENHIYRLCRKTQRAEQIQRIGGPVFHGCKTKSGLFFSTVCEPSAVNREHEAVVWHSPDGESWRPIFRYRKDFLPMKWFQYGQVFFAEGLDSSPGVWLTPLATRYSQQSFYMDEQKLCFCNSECKTMRKPVK